MNQTNLLTSGLIATAFTSLIPNPSNAADKGITRPNLLLVLVDDVGWGMLPANHNLFNSDEWNKLYGTKYAVDYTPQEAVDAVKNALPNITKLCNEGVRFTNAYVTANVCSPSRTSILTSSYQQRFGIYILPEGESGIPTNIKLMPQVLKEAGYTNAVIGKYHNGKGMDKFRTCSPGHHPLDRGFDFFYGFNGASTNYYNGNAIFRNREHLPPSPEYTTEVFTREAINFIDINKGKPKLIYMPYNAAHGPLDTPPEKYMSRFTFASKTLNKYAAILAAVDDGVTAIIQKLKEIGEYDNTMIVFLSDNGGSGSANVPLPNNGPFSGFKGQDFQGSFRTPLFMWYGNKIKQGMVSNHLVSSMDIFPTFFEFAKVKLPKNQIVDGRSLVPILTGKSNKEVRDNLVFMSQQAENWSSGAKDQTYALASFMVRQGDYALRYIIEDQTFYLNDLSKDRHESVNLASAQPERVEAMKAIFKTWFSEMKIPVSWNKKYWQNIQYWDQSLPSPPDIKAQRQDEAKKNRKANSPSLDKKN